MELRLDVRQNFYSRLLPTICARCGRFVSVDLVSKMTVGTPTDNVTVGLGREGAADFGGA